MVHPSNTEGGHMVPVFAALLLPTRGVSCVLQEGRQAKTF